MSTRVLLKRVAVVALVGCILSGSAFAALPKFSTPGAQEMRAHYINVGQGSSVLLEFSCAAALIDTGGETNSAFSSVDSLQSYLDAFFARRSDLKKTFKLVLITHAHIDHTRGLPMVLRRYTVNSYVDNGAESGSGGPQQKAAHAKAKEASSGIHWESVAEPDVNVIAGLTDKIISPIGCSGANIEFHVLWGLLRASDGWTKGVLNNQNDSSVVTKLDFGKTSLIFPGDLEEDVHQKMIDFFCAKSVSKCATNANVYHVAHHGSYNGTSPELIKAIAPKIAVISMGPADREQLWSAVAYGHPRKDAIDLLIDSNTGVLESRAVKSVQVATRAGSKGSLTAGEFITMQMSRAVYATGWDGTVVITAKSDGSLHVDTENP